MQNEQSHAPDATDVAEAVSELKGKSQSELFDALKSATAEERAAGNLDNTRMDGIYEMLSPVLTESQREKMRQVLARLKE